MKKIKFLERCVYETEGPNKGPVFEAGKEYSLDDDKADRWIRRGKAEEVSAGKPAKTSPTLTPAPVKALGDHTIAELTDLAKEEKIDLEGVTLHDEIVKKIEAARAAKTAK